MTIDEVVVHCQICTHDRTTCGAIEMARALVRNIIVCRHNSGVAGNGVIRYERQLKNIILPAAFAGEVGAACRARGDTAI